MDHRQIILQIGDIGYSLLIPKLPNLIFKTQNKQLVALKYNIKHLIATLIEQKAIKYLLSDLHIFWLMTNLALQYYYYPLLCQSYLNHQYFQHLVTSKESHFGKICSIFQLIFIIYIYCMNYRQMFVDRKIKVIQY